MGVNRGVARDGRQSCDSEVIFRKPRGPMLDRGQRLLDIELGRLKRKGRWKWCFNQPLGNEVIPLLTRFFKRRIS